jgi:predicted enzyme related to lactoylglutathione lyase
MTQPVTYVELNSPDHPATVAFFSVVFGWDAQPFADPDYLVAPSGEQGVDTGILSSASRARFR